MARPLPGLRLCWTDPATGDARALVLQGAVRIGSSRNNDVVLPLRSVEPYHAEVLANPAGGWDLVAVTPRGLNVGGRMTPHARLLPGTEFSVGSVGFRARVLDDEARPAVPRSLSGDVRRWEPAPVASDASRGPLAAVAAVVILAVAGVAIWSGLRARPPAPPALASARPAPAPAARRPAPAPPPLEAGSLALAPAEDPAGAVAAVLVRMGGTTVPVRGFFVSAGGLLVTTRRLVLAADSFSVRVSGRAAPLSARLVASDPDHDLALLHVAVDEPVPVAPLHDDAAMLSPAFAIGASPSEVRTFVAAHR